MLTLNVPVISGQPPEQVTAFYERDAAAIPPLPGVERVAIGTLVPWREAGAFGPGFQFSAEGYAKDDGEEIPAGAFAPSLPASSLRSASRSSRGATSTTRTGAIAKRWSSAARARATDASGPRPAQSPRDVERPGDEVHRREAPSRAESWASSQTLTMRTWSRDRRSRYHPLGQAFGGGRLFVHASTDPYALVTPITRIIRELSADQPVEKAATLGDVRAEVLAPNRLNALVFGGFAGVALMIAIVGVAGVLAFSVSARTREFGIRLAIGSEPRDLLGRVLKEGVWIAAVGIVAGILGGLALTRALAAYIAEVSLPGVLPTLGAGRPRRGAPGIAVPAVRARAWTPTTPRPGVTSGTRRFSLVRSWTKDGHQGRTRHREPD